MSVYKRGNVWWYKFYFANKLIRDSAKTSSKTLAREAEKKRRRELEDGYNNLTKNDRNKRVQSVRKAAISYLADYKVRHPKSFNGFARYAVRHLVEHLGDKLLIEVTVNTVVSYQSARLREGASGKTINEEVGFLLRVMGDVGDVVRLKLKKDRKLKLPQNENCGRALTQEEEPRLLAEAQRAQSPFIFPAIIVALNTTMRDSEIRHLTWGQADFFKQLITVGKSKTAAGSGRTIPMNGELLKMLAEYKNWYEEKVAEALPGHYVFPWARSKKYDPTRPLVTFKTAWRTVRSKANVDLRFHDLRHTLITKLAESGAGDETIMAIAGHVSRRMLSRYAHIRTEAKRTALEAVATKPVVPSTEQPTRGTIQ